MPITGIYGKGGSGKNTIVAYLIKKNPRLLKFKKYVNFILHFPNTEKIDSIKLFELDEKDTGEPLLVIWDEAYTEGLDNRDSFSDENKIQSYLLFQARKNNMSIISIAQLNMLDTRWRQLEENYIYCYPRPIYDKNFKDYKGDFNYAFVSNDGLKPTVTKFSLRYKDAQRVFRYFETKKIILPKNFAEMKHKALMKNPKELLNYVDEIAEKIRKSYDITAIKVTHDNVKKMMLELELMDLNLEKYVYIKLKDY